MRVVLAALRVIEQVQLVRDRLQQPLQQQRQELSALHAENARLQAAMHQQQERDAAMAARLERLEAAGAGEYARR